MAVYTNIKFDDIKNVLSSYSLGSLQNHSPIAAGINNSNFTIITDRGKFILTILEEFSPGKNNLPFITDFMQHLHKQGIACPLPISDKTGKTIQNFQEKPLIIISFIHGEHAKTITEEHCTSLGNALAKMHLAGQSFKQTRPNPWSIPKLIKMRKTYLKHADNFRDGLKNKLETTCRKMAEKWPKNLPAGIIHADLFPDNIFFKNDAYLSGIIDFYLSGQDFFAFDLAICVNAWCFEKNKLNVKKLHALMSAYQSIRPLNNEEISSLQILHQGAALRFLLSRLYEWYNTPKDALVTPHNPAEYIEKLTYHQTHNIQEIMKHETS